MSRPTLLRLTIVLGLLSAVVFVWRVRTGPSDQLVRPAQSGTPTHQPMSAEPARPGPGPGALSARARTLLEMLQRLAAERERRAREALLAFKDDAALQRFLDRAGKNGLTVIDRLDGLRTVRVRYEGLGALQDDLLQHADDYAEIAGNALMHIPSAPAREKRTNQEQIPFGNDTLAFLGAEGDRNGWGRGVTIAIIDSGVAADATFGDRLRRVDVGRGLNPGSGDGDGHGTAVAALAAGMSSDAAGVAPSASLLSIRVTDGEGLSDVFTVSRAILAAVDAGAKIVNVSLGGHTTNGTLNAAIAYATERGALIIAAAGNDQAAQLAWPAADNRVVSVGAVDKAEQQVSFSNSGPQLKLSAPGLGVQTAWLDGQRAYVDGTSASAPLVSGAVAAVISQNPSLTPQQAAELVIATANDAGAPGADPAFGGGILNLGWAMNRHTPGYVDTAIASHYFDAENQQMLFVVQNRSSQAVTGLHLDVSTHQTARRYTVPNLAAGESYVAKTPVDAAALKSGKSVRFSTQLSTPAGLTDRVPTNNQRASVLALPTR